MNKFKGIVLYTDGGTFGTNPGYTGSGVHGYLYTVEKYSNKIRVKDIVATDKGYISKKVEHISDIEDIYNKDDLKFLDIEKPTLVNISKYVNLYGSFKGVLTNNIGELRAMNQALKYLVEDIELLDKVIIYTDSTYVISSYNNIEKYSKNNYTGSNGEPLKNVEDLQELYRLKLLLEEKYKKKDEFKLEILKIKGHSGNLGNDLADRLASVSAINSYKLSNGWFDREEGFYNFEVSKNIEFFYKDNFSLHPFFGSKRFYFNPARDFNNGTYYLGYPGDGQDDNSLGKEISDAGLSLVKLKDKDPVLETIKEEQKLWLIDREYSLDTIVTGCLSNLSKALYNEFRRFGKLLIKAPLTGRPDLGVIGSNPPQDELTQVLDPPYLAMRVLDKFSNMDYLLESFRNNQFDGEILEITDKLYDVEIKNDKEVYTLKSDIDNTVKYLSVDIKVLEKDINIKLNYGIDLLARNNLKRLEECNPKVYLLTWMLDLRLYGYASVIVTKDDDYGIWMASYSGNFLI